MQTIWKYEIPIADEFTLMLKKGGRILCVQVQRGIPCIWVIVDTEAEEEARCFMLRGTGHELAASSGTYYYIGTFQLGNGDFVGHLFERGN